ncbi:tyrosine-type recombinase/integrase [Lysinibacillus halotolerans]|uniref:Site-specific integrase n=1 Tax=Lysinibacillus halotolerans TaxID=1368476 RepID=A0A3M8H749_9BACI|nr:tyrosine-type recombinase/integrase [Lysinibacillus halotolerans]RNC98251.1 site-specific integrase [Lysinibacillus halotolerans]
MRYVEPIRETDWLEEFINYFKENNMRDYVMFMVGIHTGLRISDILLLKKKDVLGTHIMLFEKKTGKQKRFIIPRPLKKILDDYIKDLRNTDYLFKSQKTTSSGKQKPIDRTRAYRILQEAAIAIGYPEPIGTHSMRKTFGYNFYSKYKEVASLMKIFNHNKETTTLFYIGVGQDDLDEKIAGLYR